MNWDISLGRSRQVYGRLLQALGERLNRRQMVLNGEAVEYAGRLQSRYGALKHQVQWSDHALRTHGEPIRIKRSITS